MRAATQSHHLLLVGQLEALVQAANSLDGNAHRTARALCARLLDSPTIAGDDVGQVLRIEAYVDVLFTSRRHEPFGGAPRVRERVLAGCAALRGGVRGPAHV